MAHKHNRRRIRPRSRNNNTLVTRSLFDRSPIFVSGIGSDRDPPSLRGDGIYPATTSRHVLNQDPTLRGTKLSQNTYAAWQSWTHRQREEAANLEREQIKLFGGVPGDDVGLCYRMLEYFGGLDFIDT